MKIYLSTTTRQYHEKQADVPKGEKFETVDFPFAASPKADFVDWLNSGDEAEVIVGSDEPTVFERHFIEARGVATPLPTQPDPHHARQIIAFEDAFAGFPLALKLHYAGLALEDAREKVK